MKLLQCRSVPGILMDQIRLLLLFMVRFLFSTDFAIFGTASFQRSWWCQAQLWQCSTTSCLSSFRSPTQSAAGYLRTLSMLENVTLWVWCTLWVWSLLISSVVFCCKRTGNLRGSDGIRTASELSIRRQQRWRARYLFVCILHRLRYVWIRCRVNLF